MREPERRTFYLVGTPRGKIKQHEKKWLDLPWQKVREAVEVKLYQHEGELYVLAKSQGRQGSVKSSMKERMKSCESWAGRVADRKSWGLYPQTPRIYRFRARIWSLDLGWGSELVSLPTKSRPLGRRSGRIPAWPYPPPRPTAVYAQNGGPTSARRG